MKTLLTAVVALSCLGLAGQALASDPTGTWKSIITFHNQQLENTFALRLDTEGPTLTGDYRDGLSKIEAPIANASYKSRRISFSVVREVGGDKFTIRYAGTLSGDTITGKCNVDYGDRSQSTDWVARRQK